MHPDTSLSGGITREYLSSAELVSTLASECQATEDREEGMCAGQLLRRCKGSARMMGSLLRRLLGWDVGSVAATAGSRGFWLIGKKGRSRVEERLGGTQSRVLEAWEPLEQLRVQSEVSVSPREGFNRAMIWSDRTMLGDVRGRETDTDSPLVGYNKAQFLFRYFILTGSRVLKESSMLSYVS